MSRSIEAASGKNQPQSNLFLEDTRLVVLDDINSQNLDRKPQANFKLNYTVVIARPADRIMPPTKARKTNSTEVRITPWLGENSRLSNTGWQSKLEGRRFFENYNLNLRVGKTSMEALTITLGELELNMRHYIREFVQAGVVLPDSKKIQEINGVRRLVGNNGVPLVSCISAKERLGANLDATILLDQFIPEPIQPIEDTEEVVWKVGVINSPNGWNGITKDYLDNQTIVSWVDEFGVHHGATLVTDLDQIQSRQLSIDLGVKEDFLTGSTEAERVSNIVRNPALFVFPKSNQNPVEFVYDKILAIRGTSDIKLEQLDGSVEYRSAEGVKGDIKKLDELLKFNQNCEKYLSKLRNFILRQINKLDNSFSQHRIMSEIDLTILLMTDDQLQDPAINSVRFDKIATDNLGADWVSDHNTVAIRQGDIGDGLSSWSDVIYSRLSKALAFLETRAGCSQAARKTNRVQLRGSSLGSVNASNSTNSGEVIGGACKVCGLTSADDHYHCECGERFDNELKKRKGAWTPGCSNCGELFVCAAA